MEACIARGGISHVLSQARASLKNPSRPYTPRTTARPLFHGDDYRPGSRPSSSYTVTEQKEFQQRKQTSSSRDAHAASPASSVSMLPPRSSAPKKKSSASAPSCPEDPDPSSATMTSSASHLKLVHAPVIPDDEKVLATTPSRHDIYKHEVDSDADSDANVEDDHLEASLELPSQDQLYQTYSLAEGSIEELASLSDPSKAAEAIENLRSVVNSFLRLSSFFLSSNPTRMHPNIAAETAKVQELRLHLFQAISNIVLGQWSHSAECVLVLTPCLFELYSSTSNAFSTATPIDSADSSSGQQAVLLGKLLFMLSKESVNDAAFCNVQYVEAALSAISKACGSLHNPKDKLQQRRSSNRKRESPETNDNVVQIGSISLVFPMKMLIYVAGTLKNTSNAEEKMLKLLATNGAIAILSDTMLWRPSDPFQAKEIAQFLIQTTGILRNLSVAKSYHKQFIEAQVPSRLCGMIPEFIAHLELMGNVSRILSKLTLHELPRAQINQHMAGNLRNLMAVVDCEQNKSLAFLDQHHHQEQRPENRFQDILLIRMFFVLGNLCAGNDRNRLFIAFDCKGTTVLLQALRFYALQYTKQRDRSDRESDTSSEQDGEGDEDSSGSDQQQSGEVLVKLVRLLANLAINAEVGAKLNNENAHMSVLLETLDQAQRVGDEELMLNIVSCITNLSYYSTPGLGQSSSSSSFKLQSQSFIEGNRIVITSLLAQILLDRNEEAVVEATRAFGNLTRFKDVLCYMSEHKVLDCFVVLLDHSNREIVYTVCGVLMNAALDESTRQQLLRVRPETAESSGDGGRGDVRNLLLGIVECAATDDVEMTCIACKVLYNLLLADERKSGHRGGGDGDVFDSKSLHRVVQQIIKTMEAQDTRRSGGSSRQLNQKIATASTRKNGVGRVEDDGNEDTDDGEDDGDDDDLPSGWRELRLVLPQLLRSTGN